MCCAHVSARVSVPSKYVTSVIIANKYSIPVTSSIKSHQVVEGSVCGCWGQWMVVGSVGGCRVSGWLLGQWMAVGSVGGCKVSGWL